MALVGVWLLQPWAARLGLLDHPAGRKAHERPTPVTGGLAMLVAAAVVTIVIFGVMGPASLAFGLAALLVTLLGVADDRFDLRWYWRMGGQVLAALILVYVGGIRVEYLGDVLGFGTVVLGPWAVPFTVFATVGIINAVNMIDGADGLAGGLVLASLVMLCAAALYAGNIAVLGRGVVLVGAVGGFLLYNLRLPRHNPARIFMGNGGSAFLGLAVACFSFRLTQNSAHPVGPLLALWMVPVPVMDCLVLLVRRLRHRRSPFAADRSHIHHLMQEAGFGPNRIVVSLMSFSFAAGLTAAVAYRMHVPHALLALAFVLLCLAYFWLTSRRVRAVAFFAWWRRPVLQPGDSGLEQTEETGG